MNTIAALDDYPVTDLFATNNSLSQTDLTLAKENIQQLPISRTKTANSLVLTDLLQPVEVIQHVEVVASEIITAKPVDETVSTQDIHLLQEKDPTADDYLKDFSYNKTQPFKRPAVSKFGFQFYVTPSTSYRRLSDEKVREIIQPAVTSLPVNTPLNQL